VQFHPESIKTPVGMQLLENFINRWFVYENNWRINWKYFAR
jgi:GMP synthase-like glutamine amidotransferase